MNGMITVYFFSSFIFRQLFVVISFFTKKFLCMIVKYVFRVAIHMKNIFQFLKFLPEM